jgi:aminoglycoside phosphotransferase (APT) family kinase protein
VQHYPGPPDRAVIVHGDFKANNILMRRGEEPTVIDWELAHVGDRHEDLAWTMAWTSPHDIVGGMLTCGDYIAAYAELSGHRVDPQRLQFWQMFALVKLAAIFLKGLEPRLRGEPLQPLHLMLGQAVPRLELAIFDLLLAGDNG